LAADLGGPSSAIYGLAPLPFEAMKSPGKVSTVRG